jgi:prepilin-type N-terminal cleavage/methylation domain-containing protein
MQRVSGQRGVSFVEVLAALVVFSIVVIGLSPALLSSRKVAELGKNQSIATALAQDKIEQLRVSSSPITGNDGPLQPSGAGGGIFSRSWTVTADTPIPNVNRVAVTVTWRDRPNTSSVTLVTLVPL